MCFTKLCEYSFQHSFSPHYMANPSPMCAILPQKMHAPARTVKIVRLAVPFADHVYPGTGTHFQVVKIHTNA